MGKVQDIIFKNQNFNYIMTLGENNENTAIIREKRRMRKPYNKACKSLVIIPICWLCLFICQYVCNVCVVKPLLVSSLRF